MIGPTIHLPPDLIDSVDHRASELGLSRNRYIRRALEQAVEKETAWSSAFREELAAAANDPEDARTMSEVRKEVAKSRTSKATSIT